MSLTQKPSPEELETLYKQRDWWKGFGQAFDMRLGGWSDYNSATFFDNQSDDPVTIPGWMVYRYYRLPAVEANHA